MKLREPLLHALCFFPVNVVFSDSFVIEPKSYSNACLCPTPKNHLLENVDVTPAETQIGSYGSSTWNDVRITNAWKDNKWGLGRLWVIPTSHWADPSAQASPRTALKLSFLAFPSLLKCLFNYSCIIESNYIWTGGATSRKLAPSSRQRRYHITCISSSPLQGCSRVQIRKLCVNIFYIFLINN